MTLFGLTSLNLSYVNRFLIPFLLLSIVYSPETSTAQNISPAELRTQYTENPIGLDEQRPGLSWKLESDQRGARQTGYRILVASDREKLLEGESDIWDSGKVFSDDHVQIHYSGPDLKSAIRYYWTVSVWDHNDEQSEYAEHAFFETGLLNRYDWEANWISAVHTHWPYPSRKGVLEPQPAPHFRKSFTSEQTIASARLYISGLGYYEAFLNGERIGDHVLDPMKTRYDKTALYVAYDVTDMIQQGENAMGVILGTGWYNFHAAAAWDFDNAPWRAPPSLKAQLVIKYTDESKQTVITDRSWKVNTGPIVFDGIHNGETYDARLELGDWSSPGIDTLEWDRVYEVLGPNGELKNQLMPPIRHVRTLSAVEITNPESNLHVFDFGQNISGRVRLVATGPEGAEIIIRHGERLYDDGTLDYEELERFVFSGETQTSRYIFGADHQPSDWSPAFAYHGFQYAQAEVPEGAEIIDLRAEVLHTDFETAGSFTSSNKLFDKIHDAKLLSFLGNYHGYPTDCPHREKIGWSGDAHLVTEGALFNFNSVSAYIKWLDDFVDEQRITGQIPGIIPTSGWGYQAGYEGSSDRNRGYGPQWEGAFVLIPWYLYLHTGDRSILERYYEPINKYVRYLERHAEEDYTLSFGIDDHKTLTETRPPILATGFFHTFSERLARMAKEIDKQEDVEYYKELSQKIKKGYKTRFYDEENQTWGNGGQASLAGTLYHNLAEPDEAEQILEQLLNVLSENDYHLDTGVVGTKYLLKVLTDYGHADIMYKIADKRTFPSWGYWMDKGATTLWQNWDGSQSRNHVMFGSIDEWFYKALAGIRPDPVNPGFKNVIIHPEFIDDLDWAKGTNQTWRGEISSEWKKTDQKIDLKVNIPANTTATVYLPEMETSRVLENGSDAGDAEGVTIAGTKDGLLVLNVESGSYHFTLLMD